MAVPKLTNVKPPQASEFSIKDHIPVEFKVPLGVGNPPNVTVEINDRIVVPNYVVKDEAPDLASQIIKIKPYNHNLMTVPVTPQNPPYAFSLPLLDVIGFHVIEIVAFDSANPADIFQIGIRVQIVYP
jgi:hypothetical protein